MQSCVNHFTIEAVFQTATDPNDSHGLILRAISSHLREIVAPMLQYSG
jgi:hypothetical protein